MILFSSNIYWGLWGWKLVKISSCNVGYTEAATQQSNWTCEQTCIPGIRHFPQITAVSRSSSPANVSKKCPKTCFSLRQIGQKGAFQAKQMFQIKCFRSQEHHSSAAFVGWFAFCHWNTFATSRYAAWKTCLELWGILNHIRWLWGLLFPLSQLHSFW